MIPMSLLPSAAATRAAVIADHAFALGAGPASPWGTLAVVALALGACVDREERLLVFRAAVRLARAFRGHGPLGDRLSLGYSVLATLAFRSARWPS